jgi:hypothetical protein
MGALRLGWLKLICLAMLFGLNYGWTYAAPPVTTTVYPTGFFPLDVQNVQAAIDKGGTVILKATNAAGRPTAFNFGPPDPQVGGTALLTTDVSILGQQIGQFVTTIEGGYAPITGLLPVKSTIQGIHFEGPLLSAINLSRSTGADIVGNHISGIVPAQLSFATEIEGIFVSGFDDPQKAITGKVRIVGNVIEVTGGEFVNGIQFDEVSADIEISENTVRFVESDGIFVCNGITVIRSHGDVSLINNLVAMGQGNPDAFPVGIFVGGHAEARYEIRRNTVTAEHPNSDGMDVDGGFANLGPTQHAIVEGNHVRLQSKLSTAGGIVFFGAVKNSLMAANKIEGTSGNAIQILGRGSASTAESNYAVGNDISGLTASAGDVFFGPDSIDNLFAGHCKTSVDLGIGNRILCGRAIGSSASAARVANRPGPELDMLDDIQRARLDAMRNRLNR